MNQMYSIPSFNSFQVSLVNKLEEMCKSLRLKYRIFICGGTWNGETDFTAILKVEEYGVEFATHIDGANIYGSGLDIRFEIYDYDDLEQLASHYLNEVARVLSEAKDGKDWAPTPNRLSAWWANLFK